MKKKLTAVVLAIALALLGAAGAYAAGLIFSPRAEAGLLASQALEARYGVTPEMLAYFHQETEKAPDGQTVVTFRGLEGLEAVLGVYTVTVEGKEAQAVWSLEGQDTSGGLDAPAWGREQLQEMMRLYQQKGDTVEIFQKAQRAAQTQMSAQAEAALSEEDFDRQQAAFAEKSRLTEQELVTLAREAAQLTYQLTPAQAEKLAYNPYLSAYTVTDEGALCYEVTLTLIQQPPADPEQRPEYTPGDGDYLVLVNTETGVIENIQYMANLLGNG